MYRRKDVGCTCHMKDNTNFPEVMKEEREKVYASLEH